ncbi:MAG TPA: PIN domain-containing protein [Rhodanobacteraceae bacterium]|nr:PIN domain-containing protein [Rhodanobacteraceae bacterium]
MEPLDAAALADGALLLVDSTPIIYTLEAHARFAARFAPMFQRHADGEIVLAVTTITIAEVLSGPLKVGEEALAKRYRAVLEGWQVVDFTCDIAESAARLRGKYSLKLPDAIQVASALSINAGALVTHDRDFANVRGLRILV